MNTLKKFLVIFFISLFSTYTIPSPHVYRPRLTVIMVVDQFAYSYLQKVSPFLNGGLKELMRKGVNYTNAYVPHGIPATATGHTGLNTGTFAKDHGIIRNSWIENNKKIMSDDDTSAQAAVFSPNGLYNYGKSAHKIMVDGISDQFVLSSQPNTTRHAIAISLKSRAAICTANKLGKAFWFDEQSGLFTSSLAYFDTLPMWVKKFNEEKNIPNLSSFFWKLAKPRHKFAYNFYGINDYSNTELQQSLIGRKIAINPSECTVNRFEEFVRTPQANQLLLDFARTCVKHYMGKEKNEELMLWIDMSGLDLIGHEYGPQSKEAIDFIYHMDAQLGSFIRFAQRMGGKKHTLFVLTADHGITPIPEHLAKGLGAERISDSVLMNKINKHIAKKFDVEDAIVGFQAPQLYVHEKLLAITPEQKSGGTGWGSKKNALSRTTQYNVLKEIKKLLLQEDFVKQVWLYDELERATFEPNQIENYFKQQLYPGRSGTIIIQTHPYKIITRWKTGADHRTPYESDTHVPLILYQHGVVELKKVYKRVWNIQLANTLADILNISKPSASTFESLPDLYMFNACCL